MSSKRKKLGILGGGQLARMMIPTLKMWDIPFAILDTADCVCAPLCKDLRIGDFKNADDVANLFSDRDIVTFDLEAISLEGVARLEEGGVAIAPSSQVMSIIQDKGKQKNFFKEHAIPTAAFKLVDRDFEQLPSGFIKLRKDGYDGKGVFSWKTGTNFPNDFRAPLLWEEKVEIEREVSVLVVRDQDGHQGVYEPVDMVFNHELNLIDYTLFPSALSAEMSAFAKEMALKISDKLNMVGLLAVEMFLTKQGKLLINELAPRPHNSGHHTIESHYVSQFENHLRAVLGYPLGKPKAIFPSSLTFNLLGDGNGKTEYDGLEKLIAFEHIHVHLYGKGETRSGRKMGHVTITGESSEEVMKLYEQVKNLLTIRGSK